MLLGLLSLYLIQRVVVERLGAGGLGHRRGGAVLGSFGISWAASTVSTVGRFLQASRFAGKHCRRVASPHQPSSPFAIAGLFFAFLALAYLTLLALMGLERNEIILRDFQPCGVRRPSLQ